jgi:hypothetical protein
MRLANHQRGLSSIGLLLVMMLGAFALTCALKLIPLYIEAATIKTVISSAVENGDFDKLSTAKIREKMAKHFETNRILSIGVRDIKIIRKKGVTTIDASYEQRVPLMFNIDVVVKFEDFTYEYKIVR